MKNLKTFCMRKLAGLSLGGATFIFLFPGNSCLSGDQGRNFVEAVGDSVIAIGVNAATDPLDDNLEDIVNPPAVILFQDVWGNYIDPRTNGGDLED